MVFRHGGDTVRQVRETETVLFFNVVVPNLVFG